MVLYDRYGREHEFNFDLEAEAESLELATLNLIWGDEMLVVTYKGGLTKTYDVNVNGCPRNDISESYLVILDGKWYWDRDDFLRRNALCK